MSDKAIARGKGQTSGKQQKRPGSALANAIEDFATTHEIGKLGKNNRKIQAMTNTGARASAALKRRVGNT